MQSRVAAQKSRRLSVCLQEIIKKHKKLIHPLLEFMDMNQSLIFYLDVELLSLIIYTGTFQMCTYLMSSHQTFVPLDARTSAKKPPVQHFEGMCIFCGTSSRTEDMFCKHISSPVVPFLFYGEAPESNMLPPLPPSCSAAPLWLEGGTSPWYSVEICRVEVVAVLVCRLQPSRKWCNQVSSVFFINIYLQSRVFMHITTNKGAKCQQSLH